MNQLIDLNNFFYNIKRVFYVGCVLAMTMGLPVLSYLELSKVEQEKKIETTNQVTAKKITNTVSIPKI